MQLQSEEATRARPRNTVGSVGSTSVCLSATLICTCNQLIDRKVAVGLEGRAEIAQAEPRELILSSAQRFSLMVMQTFSVVLLSA